MDTLTAITLTAVITAVLTLFCTLITQSFGARQAHRFALLAEEQKHEFAVLDEERKRRIERADKLQATTREAIELAMKWLNPIRNAIPRAELSLHGDGTNDSARLISELSKLDLPDHLIILLPKGTYRMGFLIAQTIDKIADAAMHNAPIDDSVALVVQLRKQSEEIHKALEAAYLRTFE